MNGDNSNLVKVKTKKDRLIYVTFFILVVFIAAILVHLLFGSKAAIPATFSLSNPCGVKNVYDASAYNPPSGQAALSNNINGSVIAAYPTKVMNEGYNYDSPNVAPYQLTDVHIQTVGGKTYIFTLNYPTSQVVTISIANLSSPSTNLLTFSTINIWNNQPVFTVDPNGNIYIYTAYADSSHTSSAPTIYKYSPFSSGILTTNSSLSPSASLALGYNAAGGVFGYLGSNNTFYIGIDKSITNSGANQYIAQATANIYDSNLNLLGTNSIDAPIGLNQSANGDLVSVDSGMLYAYSNSVTTQNPYGGSLKFQMGTGNSPGTQFNIVNASNAIEDTDGSYYVSGPGIGISHFSAQGQFLGTAPDYQAQNEAANTVGTNPRSMTAFNGTIYYYVQNLNPFASGYNTPGLYSMTTSQMNIYTSYPQGATSTLGLGAGLTTQKSSTSTPVPDNYFSNGSTPSVSLALYPWWASQISNYTITYEVRSIDQINANLPGTTQTVSIPSTFNSSTPTYIPLNLSGQTTPGAYQISAHIYSSNNLSSPVGADCIDYSVGGSSNPYNPASTNFQNPVEQAHQLGQNMVRSPYGLDDCLSLDPGTTSLSSLPTLSCPASVSSDITNQANLAKSYGMTYVVQIGNKPNNLDKALVDTKTTSCPNYKNGVSISMWECLVYQFATSLPSVTTWMSWNEINNTNFSLVSANTGSNAVSMVFAPTYNAIKTAGTNTSTNETVIAGSILSGSSLGYVQDLMNAGLGSYMDGFDVHPYPGDNRSYEEQGEIIPPLNANPGESTNLGLLDQMKKIIGAKPISDSEYGVWQTGQSSTYAQGDILVRGTILQNSIGINNIAVFLNNICSLVAGVNWGTIGCGHGGGDEPAVMAEATMHQMLLGSNVSSNRKFKSWIPTGIPHTYAALYGGTSANDTTSVVVVWADDFNTNIIPTISGGGSINLTGEYGETSTISSGSSMPISGQVQYISIPSAQTLSFAPTESFGNNLTLLSSSNKVTASSTSTNPNCVISANNINNNAASNVLLGLDDILNLPSCGVSQTNGWAPTPNDTGSSLNTPALTISLPSTQTIDRIFLSSSSIHSVDSGIRNAIVSVSADGSTWTNIGSITNNFTQRNWLFSFNSQTVKQIRIDGLTSNFSGYSAGVPPVWWQIDSTSLADAKNHWYAPSQIYDVEAYGPAQTSSTTNTPLVPNAPSGLAALTKSATEIDLSWGASTLPSGDTNQLAGYKIYRAGSLIGTSTTTSYKDTSLSAGTSYTYTVQAYDNATTPNYSTQSSALTANTYPVPSTPTLSGSVVNSSSISINWNASIDTGGPGIAAYYLKRTSGTSSTTFTINSPSLSYSDSSLNPNQSYTYSIVAVDNTGDESSSSPSITLTTPNPPDTTPPSVPTISITSSTYNSVSISWTAAVDNAGGSGLSNYTLYRNGVAIASPGSSVTSYLDSVVAPSTNYSYTVSATDNANNSSAQSSPATLTTPSAPVIYPVAPSTLSANVISPTSVALSWNSGSDVGGPGLGGYYIIRNGVTVASVNSSTLNYSDSSLTPSTSYSYQVLAYDISSTPLTSKNAATTTVSTPAPVDNTPPSTVSGLVASAVSNSQINLSWTPSTDNVGVAGYYIYINGSSTPVATSTTTSFGDSGLNTSTSYTYSVVAFDAAGNKSPATTTSAMTLANPNTVSVYGTITNSSNSPLSDVNVSTGYRATANGSINTTSNSSGQYILINIVPGSAHNYFFSAVGYNTQKLSKNYSFGNNLLNVSMN